jgi:hypothetical protein
MIQNRRIVCGGWVVKTTIIKGPGLKYGFFPRSIQTKIFWKNNLEGSQKGLAKYEGRGPKIVVVIDGQISIFFVWRWRWNFLVFVCVGSEKARDMRGFRIIADLRVP